MTYTTGRETGTWAPANAARSGGTNGPGTGSTGTAGTTDDAGVRTGTTDDAARTGTTDDAARTGTGTGTSTGTSASTDSRLLPQDEFDRLALRMQQAVTGFVDGPRGAVKEADHVLEDIAARFTEAMTERRRRLRASWQPDGSATGPDTAGDTEQLRLALRDYRELAERLLRV